MGEQQGRGILKMCSLPRCTKKILCSGENAKVRFSLEARTRPGDLWICGKLEL